VVEVFPELVSIDSKGFQAVSYSHATVVVADALREYKEKTDKEILALQAQVNELKEIVQRLLKKN
jgi:hypothetical protein